MGVVTWSSHPFLFNHTLMKHRPFFFLSWLLLGFLLLLCSCDKDAEPSPPDEEDLPIAIDEEAYAFKGAEGFGRVATGGRGGQVIYVTNLNDSGNGSLRAAITASGARYILFKISGNIVLSSPLVISNGNVTIAGQTAPGDGITILNHPVTINTDNVIIRFLRFRMGDGGAAEADALGGRYRKNIIIDHCSMSWSTDECSSFYGNENFTMQWCIISESLRNSVHEKGLHGYGGIWGGKNASFHHNLLAHHDNRNPRFDHPGVYSSLASSQALRGIVDFRNNVVYNWKTDAIYGGEAGTFNVIANYFKPGPATSTSRRFLHAYTQSATGAPIYGYGSFFVADNVIDGQVDITSDNRIGIVAKNGSATDKNNMLLASALTILPFSNTHTAYQAYEKVLLYAGASFKRDAVDSRIVNDVTNKTFFANGSNGSLSGLIDSQQDVGGWPVLAIADAPLDSDNDGMPDGWEVEMKLDQNTANANLKQLSTGYENLEVYLNSIVKSITDNQ